MEIKIIKTYVCSMNVEASLIQDINGKFAILIRDLDAGELIEKKTYPSRSKAELNFIIMQHRVEARWQSSDELPSLQKNIDYTDTKRDES